MSEAGPWEIWQLARDIRRLAAACVDLANAMCRLSRDVHDIERLADKAERRNR